MWWSMPSWTSSNAVSRDALQQRPGLVGGHRHQCPRSCSARTMPSAVPHSTHASPPVLQCVCTRSRRADQLLEQRGAALGQRPVGAHVLLAQLDRLGDDGVDALVEPGDDPPHRPRQVDGRRPGRGDRAASARTCVAEAVPLGLLGGERHGEPAGHADRRRTAHGQPPDGVDHRVDVTHLQPHDLVGQPGLVDQDGVVATPLDGAHQAGS